MYCPGHFQDPSVTQVTHGVDHMQQYQPFPDNNPVGIYYRISNISNKIMSNQEKSAHTFSSCWCWVYKPTLHVCIVLIVCVGRADRHHYPSLYRPVPACRAAALCGTESSGNDAVQQEHAKMQYNAICAAFYHKMHGTA